MNTTTAILRSDLHRAVKALYEYGDAWIEAGKGREGKNYHATAARIEAALANPRETTRKRRRP